jgi:hypothetical protein
MQNDYARFLAFRETQRQLGAKFARPWLLLAHVFAFVVTLTALWAYGIGARLWLHYDNLILPTLIWGLWSLILVGHAGVHYQHSAGRAAQRERAVEAEMRALMKRSGTGTDSAALFEMHQALEADLERAGRWSAALTAFALVNAISWLLSLLNPTSSWPFQTTLPFALMIVGGVQVWLAWQQQRADRRNNGFTRLPLWHIFIYPAGVILLWALGAYRAINSWDANRVAELWLVVLLAHIVWSVAVVPLLQWGRARVTQPEQAAKRKPYEAVTLGDDGELVALRVEDELEADSGANDAAMNAETRRTNFS